MTRFDDLMGDLNKHFGDDNIFGKGVHHRKLDKIPFTSVNLTRSLYGGLPRGMVVEFSGEENSGKTTTALDACGQAQQLFRREWEAEKAKFESKKKLLKSEQDALEALKERGPQKVLFVDCEHTFDEEWARKLGVNVDELFMMRPFSQTAEEIFEAIVQLTWTGEVGLVVLDSLGVMVSQQEFDGSIEQSSYCGIAGALTKFSKKMEMACAKTNCTLIGINQLRDNIGGGQYGPATKTTGGRAWKHVCCLRMSFKKGGLFDAYGNGQAKKFEEPAGNWVDAFIEKTKICKPDRRKSWYKLDYDTGIDWRNDYLDLFFQMQLICQVSSQSYVLIDPETGAWIQEDGKDLKFRGEGNAKGYLIENPELFERFRQVADSRILDGS